MRPLTIATRGSQLALAQTQAVRQAMVEISPALDLAVKVVRTSGDALAESPVRDLNKGMFTSEIERMLLTCDADLAVHSLKDLPTDMDQGLTLAAVCMRDDAADALVAAEGMTLDNLPEGAEILTGSVRRRAQLLAHRGDLKITPVRGNVPTRLAKLDESDAAGCVLACAGLLRLGLGGLICRRLDPEGFLPAAGQGALAVQTRSDDRALLELLAALDDPESRLTTTAERAFLGALGAGCHTPAGAYGRLENGVLRLTVMLAEPDGKTLLRSSGSAGDDLASAGQLGRDLADELLSAGGRELLDSLSGEGDAR